MCWRWCQLRDSAPGVEDVWSFAMNMSIGLPEINQPRSISKTAKQVTWIEVKSLIISDILSFQCQIIHWKWHGKQAFMIFSQFLFSNYVPCQIIHWKWHENYPVWYVFSHEKNTPTTCQRKKVKIDHQPSEPVGTVGHSDDWQWHSDVQREPQYTPVEHTPNIPNTTKWKEFRTINCWLGVWGMLQGFVGKFLEMWFGGLDDQHFAVHWLALSRREWGNESLYIGILGMKLPANSLRVGPFWKCLYKSLFFRDLVSSTTLFLLGFLLYSWFFLGPKPCWVTSTSIGSIGDHFCSFNLGAVQHAGHPFWGDNYRRSCEDWANDSRLPDLWGQNGADTNLFKELF